LDIEHFAFFIGRRGLAGWKYFARGEGRYRDDPPPQTRRLPRDLHFRGEAADDPQGDPGEAGETGHRRPAWVFRCR